MLFYLNYSLAARYYFRAVLTELYYVGIFFQGTNNETINRKLYDIMIIRSDMIKAKLKNIISLK